ncbi:MAG: SET domain-containing protein [Blastocatellales bacterium]
MLLINARVGVSAIHGFGLIAQEFIPKGTCIWRFQPGFDLLIGEEEFQSLSASTQRQIRHYAFFDTARRVYVLSNDDDRFTNHSETPNSQEEIGGGGYKSYATRDIRAGEEITCDYRVWGIHEFLPPCEETRR